MNNGAGIGITNKETSRLVVVDMGVQARLYMDGPDDMPGLTDGGCGYCRIFDGRQGGYGWCVQALVQEELAGLHQAMHILPLFN